MAQLFNSLKEKALDALFQLHSVCCAPSAKVKINGRSYNIVKVLGEGGFSFVYLARDVESGTQFALKKIRCPTGSQGVKEAMREVEAYRRFRHPNIIRILDSAVVQDHDGEGQIVYLFLPFYQNGNLQDMINHNSINGTHTNEKKMLQLFHGTCLGVRAMHDFRVSAGKEPSTTKAGVSMSRALSPIPDRSNDDDVQHESANLLGSNNSTRITDDAEPDDDGDGEGYSYAAGGSVPQAIDSMQASGADVVFDGDEELAKLEGAGKAMSVEGDNMPYAHRDIKPANIMVDDNGEAILMDFGSTVRARKHISTRQQALTEQDLAAEQSTMPYRAPELFDVKTDTTIDEKVDIWSLGCTLFALAYGHSPFETTQILDQGGSIAMAVLNGKYKHEPGSQYSEGFRRLIDVALIVDAAQRPDIHQLIIATEKVLRTLD